MHRGTAYSQCRTILNFLHILYGRPVKLMRKEKIELSSQQSFSDAESQVQIIWNICLLNKGNLQYVARHELCR